MSFLQSFICYQGKDNGRRFLVIQICALLLLVMLSSWLAKAIVLQIFTLVILLPLVTLSALRRMKDAEAPVLLTLAFPLFFVLTDFTLAYSHSAWRWGIFLLPLLSTIAGSLLANPNRRGRQDYRWGYYGPAVNNEADLAIHSRMTRVEPTLTPEAKLDDLQIFERAHQTASGMSDSAKIDSAKTDSTKINAGRGGGKQLNFVMPEVILKYRIAIGTVGLVLGGIFLWLALSGDEPPVTDESTETATNPAQEMTFIQKERIQKTELPDSFWIMLDQNQALTIGWQGDLKPDGDYWNAYTGKGDKSCTEIDFSIGDSYRVLRVEVKNGGDYYADFSPVDTEKLIQEIALKDRFTLCGYEFSLKGTQAVMMSRPAYRAILQKGGQQ